MKKFYAFIVMLIIASSVVAQDEIKVTKFLGIPVDGTKSAMIQKLKDKGYRYNTTYDRLEGEFNGQEVYICVVTNNNKVYRIMVKDAIYSSESNIRIRFNNLCNQFKNSKKYLDLGYESIPEGEDIGYEMTIHNKRYEAVYIQHNLELEFIMDNIIDSIDSKYSLNSSELSRDDIYKYIEAYLKNLVLDTFRDNTVWFMIDEEYGKYGILMYYDNQRNQANGEDL